jgi:hypothetical protein
MALVAELYSIPITDAGAFEPGRGGMLAWYRAPEGRGVVPGMPYYPEPASATKYNPEYDALLAVAEMLFG